MAHTRRTPDAREQVAAKHLIESHGVRAAARTLGVHHSTVKRIASGSVVDEHALVALRANAKLKTADDFKAGSVSISLPRKKPSVSWPLDAIRGARDAQLNGDFAKAAPLGTAMRLDDAIFVAHHNRTAPIGSLNLAVDSAGTTRGDSIAKKAKDLVTAPRSVLLSLASTLVLHGVAFGQVTRETLDDGEEVAMSVKEWPIEFVKWSETKNLYETKVDGGEIVDIVHGDGEWIIFAKQDTLPHQHEACVLPGSLIFAAHLDSIKSWNAASSSHGQAKLIGELPEGVPLQEGDEGTLSAEAAAFLSMLTDVISGESGAGIRPAGSKTDFVANGSSAWQVFSELAMNREKAAARVWLGNDGVLGSVGGAPGVDIATLFGVATTKVQGDVDAIEKGLYEGLYVPWTAVNFGDARLAPRLKFEIPDADAAQKNEQKKAARLAFFEALEMLKKNNMVVDQDVIDALAEEYGIDAPQLAELDDNETPTVEIQPATVAKIVRVREARAAQRLEPFGDWRDDMTVFEYEEKIKADAAARSAQPAVAPEAQNPNEPVEPASGESVSLAQPRETDGKFGNVPGAGDDAPKGDDDEGIDLTPERKEKAKSKISKARDADRSRVERSKARLAEAKGERKAIDRDLKNTEKQLDASLGPEKVAALDELDSVKARSGRLGQHIQDAESGKRAVSPEGAAVAADLPTAKARKAELDTRAGQLQSVIGEETPDQKALRSKRDQLSLDADDLDAEIGKHSGVVKGAAKREKAFDGLDVALDSGDPEKVKKAQTKLADALTESDDSAFDDEAFADLNPDDGNLFGD